jgi:hypothetical protein
MPLVCRVDAISDISFGAVGIFRDIEGTRASVADKRISFEIARGRPAKVREAKARIRPSAATLRNHSPRRAFHLYSRRSCILALGAPDPVSISGNFNVASAAVLIPLPFASDLRFAYPATNER